MLILLIFILVFTAGFILPWWTLALICFVSCWWLATKSSQAFASSFMATFIAWALLALIKSIPNEHALANRVAILFHLPSWIGLLAITGIIGGLVGAFTGLSGYYFKQAFIKQTTESKKATQ